MNWGLDGFVELLVQSEIDVEIHHLEVSIHLLINKGQILFDDFRPQFNIKLVLDDYIKNFNTINNATDDEDNDYTEDTLMKDINDQIITDA